MKRLVTWKYRRAVSVVPDTRINECAVGGVMVTLLPAPMVTSEPPDWRSAHVDEAVTPLDSVAIRTVIVPVSDAGAIIEMDAASSNPVSTEDEANPESMTIVGKCATWLPMGPPPYPGMTDGCAAG